MGRYYGMEGQELTLREWRALFEGDFENSRRVAADEIGDFRVSTVLLGIDHSFGSGPPLIFETMIFGDKGSDLDGSMWRYATRDEALAGHANAVSLVRAAVRS